MRLRQEVRAIRAVAHTSLMCQLPPSYVRGCGTMACRDFEFTQIVCIIMHIFTYSLCDAVADERHARCRSQMEWKERLWESSR